MGGMLTTDQRTKLRESMQGTEMTELSTKLAAAQKEAVQAATAKTPDEKTVRAKVEAVTKIQTDIAMLRFKAFKEIASTLTDEQKTQMESRPGMAYMMVLGGGFGGGGGRRGGGGGAGGAGNKKFQLQPFRFNFKPQRFGAGAFFIVRSGKDACGCAGRKPCPTPPATP